MTSLEPPAPTHLTSASDTSSHYTPEYTPASTPLLGTNMGDSRVGETVPKDDVRPDSKEAAKPETTNEESTTKEGKKSLKKRCKKSSKSVSKSNAKNAKKDKGGTSDSSTSSSSSSSSTDDDSDDSESSSSSSSEDEKAAKKAKKKQKKKLAAKKKAKQKAKKAAESSSDDSSDSDSSSSEEEVKSRRKSKKSRRKVEETEDEGDDEDDDGLTADDDLALRNQILLQQQRQLLRIGGRKKRLGLAASEKTKKKKVSKKSKKITPTKPQYFRADELWDRETHAYKLQETAAAADEDEYGEYIFHVRRRFDWEGKYTDTVIDIKSKTLRNALRTVMGNCKVVSFAEETPCIDPNMLFLYLEEIRAYYKKAKAEVASERKKKGRKAARQKVAQLKCLLKFIDKDYAATKKTLYPLLQAGNITFELLWTLFRSDTIIYTSTYSAPDEPRAFKVEYATKECSFLKGTWYEVEGQYLDFDGKNFGLGTMNVEVEAFKGPRRISSLPCYPVKYHQDADSIRKQLIERGKKFVSLSGMKYKFHNGLGFMKRKRQVLKVSTNSRVMLDPLTFRRINPNYPISTIKSQDPDFLPEDDSNDEEGCSCCEEDGEGNANERLDDADRPKYRLKLVMDKNNEPHIVEVEVDENGDELNKNSIVTLPNGEEGSLKREFTEEELLIASPVILGFAFSEKLWLEFTVSGVHDIEWNEGAFDSLVLPDSQKSIVKALVQSHTTEIQERRTIDDVIKGKGKGLVAVLHGSPGVGKTLTAEGIAELLKCPLYSVSAGELGTNPRELEQELTKILDVAHSWGAVLLLDEADVFLEARTAQDIHRNALVSIFLRVLEYFQGILFLTTNRVSSFDDAFQSRIHIALRYQELDFKARRAIFKMFLDRVAASVAVADAIEAKGEEQAPSDTISPPLSSTVTATDTFATPALDSATKSTPSTATAELTTRAASENSSEIESTTVAAASPTTNFSDADLERLARKGNLNGRQIKNAVRSAQALAVNEKVPLSVAHVLKVLDVAEAFESDLKGGSGYLDAMRSYT